MAIRRIIMRLCRRSTRGAEAASGITITDTQSGRRISNSLVGIVPEASGEALAVGLPY